MYNVLVNEIPEQKWFSEKARELVNNFNSFAKDNKKGCLVLSLYEEPENSDDLDCMLEEGMYDFKYPTENPYSEELKQMVEEAEKYPRYLGFDRKCLWI